MKNLNIYTWRELSQMYVDGRPMPDVAFVTQTDAMKLQSMCKEENEGWITDRLPKLSETDEVYVWIMSDNKPRLCHYLDVMKGMLWRPLDKPEPYVKPKRFTARWSETYGSWVIEHNGYPLPTWLNLCTNDKHREAAERIAAIYEEVLP